MAVDFTIDQRRLYDAVLEFRREVLLRQYDPGVVGLILDTLERQASSCINAMGGTIETILVRGGVIPADITDDPKMDAGNGDGLASLPTAILERARELLGLRPRSQMSTPSLIA